MHFQEFPKTPRYSRDCAITEKIDGINAHVYIEPVEDNGSIGYLSRVGITNMIETNGYFFAAGTRSQYVTPENDTHGFAKWAYANADELIAGLGHGRHYGEWWGLGIRRNYGLKEKRFSLFNTMRWCAHDATPISITTGSGTVRSQTPLPKIVGVVPVIWRGMFGGTAVDKSIELLRREGSVASPGFMRPEGIVIWHTAANVAFKKTLENDEQPKSKTEQ